MIIVPDDPGETVPRESLEAVVTHVFDGDGFLANVLHPVRQIWVSRIPFRFAFIDAPEMEQPFGSQSKEFLYQLIMGRRLRLDPIGKQSTGYSPVDQYNRMLCMGFLTEPMQTGKIDYYLGSACNSGTVRNVRLVTRNIELEMIVNGWAWVVERWAFDREAEYFNAQDDARRNRRGLWAADRPEAPWNFKRRVKRRNVKSAGQISLL